jgi:broad specificity phosphatase PhoE
VSTDRQPRMVVVRHGETEWSAAGKHTGRTDVPLTDEGRAAAAQLASVLAGRHFSLVLTSPLQRARETAALAGFPDAEPCDDLREWDYGEDEGRTTPEIRDERPGWSVWSDGPKDGEPLAHVAVRAERVIDRALAAPGDTLAFAHAHVLRVLTARWLSLHPELGKRFRLATAAPSTLGWEHEYRVIEAWSCGAG